MQGIKIEKLKKKFGSKLVLDQIDMEFKRGRVYGILGPNGMGKTTLLKILAGVLKPSDGRIYIDEKPHYKALNSLSFCPEIEDLYPYMKVEEFFKYLEVFYQPLWDRNRLKNLAEILELPLAERIGNLSKGFRSRVKVAAHLSKQASYYLLDEPLSGIDTSSRKKIVNALKEMFIEASESITMIISSHLIGEIEDFLNYVYFLDRGVIVEQGEADELRERYNDSIENIYMKLFK